MACPSRPASAHRPIRRRPPHIRRPTCRRPVCFILGVPATPSLALGPFEACPASRTSPFTPSLPPQASFISTVHLWPGTHLQHIVSAARFSSLSLPLVGNSPPPPSCRAIFIAPQLCPRDMRSAFPPTAMPLLASLLTAQSVCTQSHRLLPSSRPILLDPHPPRPL